jgi:hypothetical protein
MAIADVIARNVPNVSSRKDGCGGIDLLVLGVQPCRGDRLSIRRWRN